MLTTKEMIAVMQAYVDGKTIEFRYVNKHPTNKSWVPISRPTQAAWNWGYIEYRVQPDKPRVVLHTDSLAVLATKYIELTPKVVAALKKENIDY
jgi:hypothetical protein